jgi:hypothetical protein
LVQWRNVGVQIFFTIFLQRTHVRKVHPCFFSVWLALYQYVTGQPNARHHPYSANIVYDFQRMIKVILMGLTFISSWFKASSSGKIISKGLFCTAIKKSCGEHAVNR